VGQSALSSHPPGSRNTGLYTLPAAVFKTREYIKTVGGRPCTVCIVDPRSAGQHRGSAVAGIDARDTPPVQCWRGDRWRPTSPHRVLLPLGVRFAVTVAGSVAVLVREIDAIGTTLPTLSAAVVVAEFPESVAVASSGIGSGSSTAVSVSVLSVTDIQHIQDYGPIKRPETVKSAARPRSTRWFTS